MSKYTVKQLLKSVADYEQTPFEQKTDSLKNDRLTAKITISDGREIYLVDMTDATILDGLNHAIKLSNDIGKGRGKMEKAFRTEADYRKLRLDSSYSSHVSSFDRQALADDIKDMKERFVSRRQEGLEKFRKTLK